MERLAKVATPATAAWVSVPDSTPPLGLVPMATVTLAVDPVWLPNWSLIRTVTAGLMAAPAAASVGCAENASAAGAAGVMLKVALVAEVRPAELATRVYPVP